MDRIMPARIRAELDQDEHSADGLTLNITVDADEIDRRNRRKLSVSLLFFDEFAKEYLKAGENSKDKNSSGAVLLSSQVRTNSAKVFVPYSLFSSLRYGQMVTARIILQIAGEDQPDMANLALFVMKNFKMVPYTHELFAEYLLSSLPIQEMLQKTICWIDHFSKEPKVIRIGVSILEELARSNQKEARNKLVEMYRDEFLSIYDPQKADAWEELPDASKPAQQPAVRKEPPIPSKIIDDQSLLRCEKAAAEGNSSAMWTIFRYYSNPESEHYEEEKSFAWLKKCVLNKVEQAVEFLEEAYLSHYVFVSEENSLEFISLLEQNAEQSSAYADYKLFEIYLSGRCLGNHVTRDKKRAFDYLLSAAKNGSGKACFKIWELFEDGNDFLMEQKDALGWLVIAAEKKNPFALEQLGDLYFDGRIVEKNSLTGLGYLQESAELKNPSAQMKQFEMCYDGRYKDMLFVIDKPSAFQLLKKYANSGNVQAKMLIWNKYYNGNEMMMEHLEALRYLEQAAVTEYPPAVFQLANLLIEGKYLQQDLKKAATMLLSASENGDANAQFALYQYYSSHYLELIPNKVNTERAFQWLNESAKSDAAAQFEVWDLYNHGNEMQLSEKSALNFLFRSAAQNYAPALYQIGIEFGKGKMIDKNTERGMDFLAKAIALGNAEAMFTLSEIKCTGIFEDDEVPIDLEDGMRLLRLSAEFEYAPACHQIWKEYQRGSLPDVSVKWVESVFKTALNQKYQPALDETKKQSRKAEPAKDAL